MTLVRATMIVLLGLTSCAGKTGWTRGDRVCEASDPPHVCFEAAPDAPLALVVGDARLAPNECAFALDSERGGSIRVGLEDGEKGTVDYRHIATRHGKTTTVVVGPELKVREEKSKCASTR